MAGKFVHTMPPHHFELLRGEATDPKSYDVFGVNMIVNRSRELGVLKSKVLGSVSQKVFNHADCSVVTVR
jgi:nucleotide-binding universal stress UspA family protein